jgi:hypothetical protein
MSVDRVNNARMKKIYREKTQQQQRDYKRNLNNLKKQQEIANKKRVNQNRETIQDIEKSSNSRVKKAHHKMDEKIESMRDYYRARNSKLGEDYRDENQRIKEEYANRLNELANRYSRAIKTQVEHDGKQRQNIKTTFNKRLNYTKRENEKRIEDLQESFSRSIEREQQQNIDNQARVKRDAKTEIERLHTGFVKKNEDYRRITTDLKENYDRNLDNLNRRQSRLNRRRADDTRKAISNIRRQSQEKIDIAVKRGKQRLGQQRNFLRTQHTQDVETFRKVNQQIRDEHAKNIEQLKFSYDQKTKDSNRRREITSDEMKKRYEERIEINKGMYQKRINEMGDSYQANLKKSMELSTAERARLQRKFELTVNQMDEAHQLQRNKMYNRAVTSLRNIQANYDKRLNSLKETYKTKEERQSKIYKDNLRQLEIEREETVRHITNRLQKRVEMAKAWHKQQMSQQEARFIKEREGLRKKINADYQNLRETYASNLKNQKLNSERRISSIKHNNDLLRMRDYNNMEETKLRLKDQADQRYQTAQARHLKQLREIERERTKDIQELVSKMDRKNSGLVRSLNKKMDGMEVKYKNRIDTLTEKNNKVKNNYNRELDNLMQSQQKKIDRLNDANKIARDDLRAEQGKQLDELSKNHQEQLAMRGKQMAQLKNRYEGSSGEVARMRAQNENKLERMKNNHFEEKKAIRDYYNERVGEAQQALKKERADLQADYEDKAQRNEQDYARLKDFSERKLDKKSAQFSANTARIKRETEKKLTTVEMQNKRARDTSRRYYEGNIQNLTKTNRENLRAQKAAYDKELKDSTDAANKTYNENLEELNRDYQERMNKTIDGYEQQLASEKSMKNRSIRKKDLSLKLLQQQQADQLALQQENNRQSRRLQAEDNKKNLERLRQEMQDNNSLQGSGVQAKIDNIEGDKAFEMNALKLKHEKEIRELDKKYKLSLKKERDQFRSEIAILKKNANASQTQMETTYKERTDKIENEYRKRLKENEAS